MSDQSVEDMGGTQRLGDYECQLNPGTQAARLYGKELIKERHRHRYEFNNNYKDVLVENGLKVAALNLLCRQPGICLFCGKVGNTQG